MEQDFPLPSVIEDYVPNAKALVIFAHGAGADKSSEFMTTFTGLLNAHQLSVLRFNFTYMDKRIVDQKRYPPERMPKLLACFNTLLTSIDTSLPIFIAGKSMGGRVAATLAESPSDKFMGVMCLGYPFHPQKKPDKLRLEPLQKTLQPILIVQGDRDALGNKDEISNYEFSSMCTINFLPDGDHDLKPRVKSGFTHQGHMEAAAVAMREFIDNVLSNGE